MIIKMTNIFEKDVSKIKDNKLKVIIQKRIERIEKDNNFRDSKSIGGGLYELRIHFGSGYRIYFCLQEDIIVLLIAGGEKGIQERDIKRAIEILKKIKKG